MDKTLRIGFVTTYSGRWPEALPKSRMKEYGDWLESQFTSMTLIKAAELGCTPLALERIAEQFASARVDVVVFLYGAFTGDDASAFFAEQLSVPLILWAPEEPPFEKSERLYANALVAMTMNAASLRRLERPYHAIYGGHQNPHAKEKLTTLLDAYALKKSLSGTLLGLFGYRPTAFYNCQFDEGLIRRTFGVRLEETDLKVVFDRMAAIEPSLVAEEIKALCGAYPTEALPSGHDENHARLYLALRALMEEQRYDYGVIKCWPEMGNLHTTPCAVLGRLMEENLPIGCEGDVDAMLAAIVQHKISGLPTFITDMIDMDSTENTLCYWHCGNAAPSLQDPAFPVTVENHPLAGQGSAFYCSLKPGPVTVARFYPIDGKYRLFLLSGEAVSRERKTRGSMVTVKTKTPASAILEGILQKGVPHHYSIVWQDTVKEMKDLCALLNVPVDEY